MLLPILNSFEAKLLIFAALSLNIIVLVLQVRTLIASSENIIGDYIIVLIFIFVLAL